MQHPHPAGKKCYIIFPMHVGSLANCLFNTVKTVCLFSENVLMSKDNGLFLLSLIIENNLSTYIGIFHTNIVEWDFVLLYKITHHQKRLKLGLEKTPLCRKIQMILGCSFWFAIVFFQHHSQHLAITNKKKKKNIPEWIDFWLFLFSGSVESLQNPTGSRRRLFGLDWWKIELVNTHQMPFLSVSSNYKLQEKCNLTGATH